MACIIVQLLKKIPDRTAGYNGTIPKKGPFLSLTQKSVAKIFKKEAKGTQIKS